MVAAEYVRGDEAVVVAVLKRDQSPAEMMPEDAAEARLKSEEVATPW